MRIEIKLGDIIRLRKKHPCGSFEWKVVRLGVDIGIKCLKCQRQVLLKRNTFEQRFKAFVPKNTSETKAKNNEAALKDR